MTRDANAPTEGVFSDVQWITGNLNKPETITADAVKGASRIIFCPGAHGWENPDNNRRIYDEAVSLLLSLGNGEVKRFVYLSSFGVAQKFPDTQDYNYLRQVYKYKRRGEAALRRCPPPIGLTHVGAIGVALEPLAWATQ